MVVAVAVVLAGGCTLRLNVTGTGVHVDVGGAVAVGRVVVALFVACHVSSVNVFDCWGRRKKEEGDLTNSIHAQFTAL